jgi:N-acyl-D-aspartate/D-glutamate deacylase
MHDLMIRGVTVGEAVEVIDARERIVTPGFVDIRRHGVDTGARPGKLVRG